MNENTLSKKAADVQNMFASIASRYDLTNTILSLGIHKIWRRKLLALANLPAHAKILDLATGTGDLLPILKEKHSHVVGSDFCFPMLSVGQKRPGHDSFPLIQGDALKLPFAHSSLDAVSIAFGVRNFENLEVGLKEINRVLSPQGSILVLEFGQADLPVFSTIYNWYSRWIMPKIGKVLTGNEAAYTYLPETAASFPSGDKFIKILEKSGYQDTQIKKLFFGIAYLYVARKC